MLSHGDMAECVLLVSVIAAQGFIAKRTRAPSAPGCHVDANLFLYPIIASCLYLVSVLAILLKRHARAIVLVQCLCTALLVAPFVELVIQPCHLATITYVTVEFCILVIWTTVVSRPDLFIVVVACCIKMYVYIGYTLMDSSANDGHRSIIMFLVLDGVATTVRVLFVSLKV